ncbi:glycoside hydrolase family 65 protein [Enterococcus crotali]
MNSEYLLTLNDLNNQSPEYIETLFALSNGHLGIRASSVLKGKTTDGNPGTFINGFYDTHPIVYGEWAYGYAKNHQTIVKLPDIRSLIIEIDGEKSNETDWFVEQTDFQLNMKTGMLEERYDIETLSGKKFSLALCSFLSYSHSEISVFQYTIEALNFSGEMVITKNIAFQKEKTNDEGSIDPRVASSKSKLRMEPLNGEWSEVKTEFSGQSVLISQTLKTSDGANEVGSQTVSKRMVVQKNQAVTLTNYVVLSKPLATENGQVIKTEKDKLTEIRNSLSMEQLVKEQVQHFSDFWQASDIEITGDPILQKGIRFNLFHLYQNAGRDGLTNFAAKGLTGEGYEGHYFWDTEMYMLPFFIYTQPEIAKQLLNYRVSILPKAQERAKEMAQDSGALFAWRTINGEEASAYYPAGTAQIHINADIAYAFQLYERVTGDHQFIAESGAEVIVETARFWLSYGSWVGNEFCINGVTGPDEYTALVNNNYYTNKMAQNNLRYAVTLAQRLNVVSKEEWSAWQKAAEGMKLPYDHEKQLIKQDDTFFEKAKWPFEETPKENYPLLLHYHPMIIYKHQVCKQADALLAEMLFPQDYSVEQIQRDYQFYEEVTTHDSSLSRSIFSILASRTKQLDKAYSYFMDTALMDLTDLQGNAKDGIHAANMGGSWLSIIYGFAGLSSAGQTIQLENHLPKEIEALAFKLTIHGTQIKVTMNQKEVKVTLLESNDRLSVEQVSENKVIVAIN